MIENLPVAELYDGYPGDFQSFDYEPLPVLNTVRPGDPIPLVPRSDELAGLIVLRMVLVRDVLAGIGWVRSHSDAVNRRLQ